MIGIYKITNNLNGKAYVGQSKHIKRRWREHLGGAEDSVISKAINKYGAENFSFGVVEKCVIKDLDKREIYYISKHNTFKHGYNMTVGGDGVKGVGKVLSYDVIPYIINDLRTDAPSIELSEKYKVSVSMISRINAGHDWAIEGENYPIRKHFTTRLRDSIDKERLLKDVATLGFKEAGRRYGITGNGIKARCEMVGLPSILKDIKEMYGIKEEKIKAVHRGIELSITTEEELVKYIQTNRLTEANRDHIKISIRRVLRGDRKTYLGITIDTKGDD